MTFSQPLPVTSVRHPSAPTATTSWTRRRLFETSTQNRAHWMIRNLRTVSVKQNRYGFPGVNLHRQFDCPVQEYRPTFRQSNSFNPVCFPDELVAVDFIKRH